MTDTPAHIHQLQLAVFNKMTSGQRIAVCLEMMEEGRAQLAANIRRKHSDWPEVEVRVATFERMYQGEFTSEKLADITNSIRAFHLKNDQDLVNKES